LHETDNYIDLVPTDDQRKQYGEDIGQDGGDDSNGELDYSTFNNYRS
jgi:hypothetical protein